MTRIRINQISKTFSQTVALDRIDLDIEPGELFFMLGPSGCGKSTLLRIVAGLQTPSSGQILFNDRDVTAEPTEKRNAVMCFQNYALWPHLTVAQNVAFGLQTHGWKRQQQQDRVREVLSLVRLDSYAGRRPNQLSGGQQQRVALARAIAVRPDCLLLDEPLSNLDATLRQEMRVEIRRICKESGSTTIYVTHDQREALSVADRICVLRAGRVEQVGSAEDLYRRPANSFVASFIGQTNLVSGTVIGPQDGLTAVQTAAGVLRSEAKRPAGAKVVASVRPEHLRPATADPITPRTNRLLATVKGSTYLGDSSEHAIEIGSQPMRSVFTPPLFGSPSTLQLDLKAEDVILLDD